MGGGSSTFTISGSADIAAYLAAIGASTITITAEGDTLEAIGWPEGSATITINGEADPMAIGFMEGTTDYTTDLTAVAVARAVWEALAADSNITGTMGEKLNDAGSASNPWTEVIDGSYTAEKIFKVIAAALGGKSSGGGTTQIKFRDLSDTKDVITATIDVNNNRTTISLDV